MGKILLIVSFVVSLLTAALGFINKGKLDTAKADLENSQAQLVQVQTKSATADKDLKDAKEQLASVTAERDSLTSQATSGKAELDAAKAQVADLTGQVTTKEAALTQAQTDLAAAQASLQAAQSAAPVVSNEPNPETQAKLQEQEALIAKLQSELDSSRSRVEVLNRENQDRQTQQLKKSLEGRVLAVNPAWNFVVLNLGDRNGVVSNAELLVKRGRELVGKVRVTSVEPSTSIADIVSNSVPRGTTIAPGDQVIFQAVEE